MAMVVAAIVAMAAIAVAAVLARMRQHLAQQRREQASGSSPVMHFRGDASGLNVNADARIVDFCKKCVTLGWTHLCPLESKGYYELEILRDDDVPQYGFVSTTFERFRI